MDRISTHQPNKRGIPVGVPDSTAVYRIHRSEEKYSENQTSTHNALGQPTTKDANVGLVNLPLQAVFSQMDCSLQQTSVTQTGTNYPYKAYIDTLLETGANDRMYSNQYF
jgi:hypothetical protein